MKKNVGQEMWVKKCEIKKCDSNKAESIKMWD